MAYKFNPFTGSLDETGGGGIPDPLIVDELTVNTLLTADHIHGNIAGTLYIHIKNTDSVALAKGTPFCITGTVGASGRVEVQAASNDDPAKGPAIGLLEDALDVNGEGNGVLIGEIYQYNTLGAGWSVNDPIYVGTSGALTTTEPTSGYKQIVGYAGRIDNSTGTIVVVREGIQPETGLAYFTETQTTASPHATVPVHSLSATDDSYTNIDLALTPKGTGALLGSIDTANKRGAYAVDFQLSRSTNLQVASGNYSVISGGAENQVSAQSGFLGGGYSNYLSGSNGVLCGGDDNYHIGFKGVLVGGKGNTCSGTYSSLLGGINNVAQGPYSTVIGGSTALAYGSYSIAGGSGTASGAGSVVLGGFLAAGTYSIAIGDSATANKSHSIALGYKSNDKSTAGKAVVNGGQGCGHTSGHAQSGMWMCGGITTSAVATLLTSDGSSTYTTDNQLKLNDGDVWAFKGVVIGSVPAGGAKSVWTFEGAASYVSGTLSIIGTPVINRLAYDVAAAAWSIAIDSGTGVDASTGRIGIQVTGADSTTIDWLAKIETLELTST